MINEAENLEANALTKLKSSKWKKMKMMLIPLDISCFLMIFHD